MKLFDKSKTLQGILIRIKMSHSFVIKSGKSDLFFNQFWKWKNNKENSLKEKLKSFILFSKVLQAFKLIKASVTLI
jgi:hypothetical protein